MCCHSDLYHCNCRSTVESGCSFLFSSQEVQQTQVEEATGRLQIGLKGGLQGLKAADGGVEIGVFQIREHRLGRHVLIVESILPIFEFFHLSTDLAVNAGDSIEVVLKAFGGVSDGGRIAGKQGIAELAEVVENSGGFDPSAYYLLNRRHQLEESLYRNWWRILRDGRIIRLEKVYFALNDFN